MLEKKVKELESIIGKQTIVIEMLKIASDLKEYLKQTYETQLKFLEFVSKFNRGTIYAQL